MSYYKSIFENSPFPYLLFEKKKDGFVIKEANALYCRVTDKIGEDLTGKGIGEVFPENPFSLGLKQIQESLKIAYTSQEPHKIGVLRYDLYDKKNGIYELRYWETENIPIFDEAKNVVYILNVVKDITAEILERDRCNALQIELDDNTEKHERFAERITDGLFSLDRECNFVSLNQGLIDIAETPETDLLKMNFLSFCGQEDREKIVKKFEATLGGENQTFEADFISGKGRKMVLEVSLVPLKNDGKITGFYGIAKDITRLKESEAALSLSERKFKALVQEGSELIGILDLKGNYKFISETSSTILGNTPKDFIGKTAFDFIHPEDQERVIKEFSALEEKNQIQIKPFRFKNAQGAWRWIETKATNLIDDPAIEGIVTNSRDVTDHMNSKKAIKENEERYRSFFENSSDAIMVTIPGGKILAANPSACKMFQRSEKELCLLGRAAITDPLDPRQTKALELRRETGTASVELTFVRKDGEKFPGEITSSIFRDSDGNSRSSMIIRDVTERKLAEKALKESEEKYRSFFENSLDGILLKDPDGRILAANTSACQMFQRTEMEICEVGRNGLVDMSDPRVSSAIKERSSTGKVMAEIKMVRKDGSIFPAAMSSAIFEDVSGQKLASIIIRDISEAKRAEEELKASENEYRKLFQNSPLPNIIYDKDTYEILDVNQAALDHYRYTRTEFLQVTILDFMPEEEILNFKNIVSNLPEKGGVVSHHSSINLKKNGERIQVETFGYGLQYKGKNCRLIIFLDITEREAALQKLKERTEKLLTAQRIAKLGYWKHDLQNDTIFWSDQVFNIWGRDNSAFQPNELSLESTIHPEDLQQFKDSNALAIKGEKELDFEHRIILPNGKVKWVHERGKLNKTKDHKAVFEGTVQDITERRNSLEKLMQSEARQRGILKSQTNYLIRTDLKGNYSYCNEKFKKDFSWIFPDNIFIGKNSIDTVNEYHHSRALKVFGLCIDNPNTVYQIEIDKRHRDGGAKTTLWDFICLTDSSGKPVELQCVGIDITDRVRIEKSLEESNVRHELVSKATSDAIYDWDLKSNVLLWGEAFYAMFGYIQKEFPPTIEAYLERIHPDEKDYISQSLNRGIQGTDNHWKAEYRFRKADGKYASVIEKGFILRDEKGKAFRMVGAIQDVTEKKKLEGLLDEASRFARIGSFEIDCEKGTMYWSPVTKEIHEVDITYDPTLEIGILFYKEGESRNAMSNAYLKALEENIPYDLEMQIVTAKGKERWVRKIGRPSFVDGKCVRINGSFQDITNIKNSELQALEASKEKEIILESIGDAFYRVDPDWTVTYWNQHSEKLLECPKDKVLGENVWEVFPDALGTKFYTSFHKAVREQSIEDFVEYFDRVQKWFEVTAYPSNSGLSVYFRDVTERKESELQIMGLNNDLKAHTEELVEANKGLEQFSFIVSHNLRSPVANIIGLADLIGNKDYPEEVRNKFLKALLENVKRLDVVISDLNAILQVKVEMDAKKEPVQLNNLVEAIKTSIQNLIEKENVQITTHFDVPAIHTVQSYLHSILYNLLSNSIKYRKPGIPPEIGIRSETKEGTVVITFEDNGLGIDLDKKREQVFGLYRRFHNHIEGKGMGLFLVKTQVELLGGKIAIESEVNTGTKFTITFNEETLNYSSEHYETTMYGGDDAPAN